MTWIATLRLRMSSQTTKLSERAAATHPRHPKMNTLSLSHFLAVARKSVRDSEGGGFSFHRQRGQFLTEISIYILITGCALLSRARPYILHCTTIPRVCVPCHPPVLEATFSTIIFQFVKTVHSLAAGTIPMPMTPLVLTVVIITVGTTP